MKIKKDTIIRTIVMVIALMNQALVIFGKEALPWSEDEVYTGLSYLATAASTVWAWWKNNSFTQNAIAADRYLEEIREIERHE